MEKGMTGLELPRFMLVDEALQMILIKGLHGRGESLNVVEQNLIELLRCRNHVRHIPLRDERQQPRLFRADGKGAKNRERKSARISDIAMRCESMPVEKAFTRRLPDKVQLRRVSLQLRLVDEVQRRPFRGNELEAAGFSCRVQSAPDKIERGGLPRRTLRNWGMGASCLLP